MSDGYSTESGIKLCNGYTDRTPRWCPLDAQSTETAP